MGYLNTQLEKVASAVEGEMEKQALTIADLARMGGKAIRSGKSEHFVKRLMQRNKALANKSTAEARLKQFLEVEPKLRDAAYMEKGYGIVGSARKKLDHLKNRIIPDNSRVVYDLQLTSPFSHDAQDVISMLNKQNVHVSANQLSDLVGHLKKRWGKGLESYLT